MIFIPEAPNSGAVEFPFDLQECFGKKSVKAKFTYDGVPYRGLLKNMGGDCAFCLIRKEIRQQIGKNPGDLVAVTVQEDTEERIVIVPEDFEIMMEDQPEIKAFFDQLSYTCRKEYVEWIESAVRLETRLNRILKAMDLLTQKRKSPNDKPR